MSSRNSTEKLRIAARAAFSSFFLLFFFFSNNPWVIFPVFQFASEASWFFQKKIISEFTALFMSAYNECVLPVQSLYTAPCKIGLLIALAIMSSLRAEHKWSLIAHCALLDCLVLISWKCSNPNWSWIVKNQKKKKTLAVGSSHISMVKYRCGRKSCDIITCSLGSCCSPPLLILLVCGRAFAILACNTGLLDGAFRCKD